LGLIIKTTLAIVVSVIEKIYPTKLVDKKTPPRIPANPDFFII